MRGDTYTERLQRWTRIQDPDALPGFLYLVQYTPEMSERPPLWPEYRAERIEWVWNKYQLQLERMKWLHDDALPYLDMTTGTEIFAEAFGCGVYRPDFDLPAAKPLIHSASQIAKLRVPNISSCSLTYLFDMADELQARAGGEALVRLVDIQSPMDIAALIWEKSSFYAALMETPEVVLELAAKVGEFLCAFLDEWFGRYGQAFIAHYPDYYMPYGVTLSEDEIGSVNSETFETFFLPELAALSKRYGQIGIHCCAGARHQWESFRALPNLRVLNFVGPKMDPWETYDFFGGEVLHMHAKSRETGPAWTWPGQYPPGCRVVIPAPAATREEAIEIADKLGEFRNRS